MTLHRKKPKMARAWDAVTSWPGSTARVRDCWWACYRWHKAVKP